MTEIDEPPLNSVSPALTSLIASSTESQTLRLRGTGASAATFKNLSACVDQAACTCTRFTRTMWARYTAVDGCLDIDRKSISCGVATGAIQVPGATSSEWLWNVPRIMITVRLKYICGLRSW